MNSTTHSYPVINTDTTHQLHCPPLCSADTSKSEQEALQALKEQLNQSLLNFIEMFPTIVSTV